MCLGCLHGRVVTSVGGQEGGCRPFAIPYIKVVSGATVAAQRCRLTGTTAARILTQAPRVELGRLDDSMCSSPSRIVLIT